METDRRRLAARLEELKGGKQLQEPREYQESTRRKLWRLREAIVPVLRDFLDRIELHFDPVQKGQKMHNVCRRGIIYGKDDFTSSHSPCSGP